MAKAKFEDRGTGSKLTVRRQGAPDRTIKFGKDIQRLSKYRPVSPEMQLTNKTSDTGSTVSLRYPRGHTPEEMREVGEAEASGKLKIDATMTSAEQANTSKARLREAIARSTLSPRQFTGPVSGKARTIFKPSNPEELATGTAGGPLEIDIEKTLMSRTGGLNSGDYRRAGDSGKIRVTPESLSGKTVAHEIGHHMDPEIAAGGVVGDIPGISYNVADEYRAGGKEGFATAVEEKHGVPDPRFEYKDNAAYPMWAGAGLATSESRTPGAWARGFVSGGGTPVPPGDPRWVAAAEGMHSRPTLKPSIFTLPSVGGMYSRDQVAHIVDSLAAGESVESIRKRMEN